MAGCGAAPFSAAGTCRFQRRLLGAQAGKAGLGIGRQRRLSPQVGVEFAQASGQIVSALAITALFGFKLVQRAPDASERRSSRRLRVTQAGQGMGRHGLMPGRLGLDAGGLGDIAQGRFRCPLGGGSLIARLAIADRGQQGLRSSDLCGQRLVATGLPRLPLQRLDLVFDLAQHIFEPEKVVLCGPQPQFGLVAARVQAGDAGGIFEDAAA